MVKYEMRGRRTLLRFSAGDNVQIGKGKRDSRAKICRDGHS